MNETNRFPWKDTIDEKVYTIAKGGAFPLDLPTRREIWSHNNDSDNLVLLYFFGQKEIIAIPNELYGDGSDFEYLGKPDKVVKRELQSRGKLSIGVPFSRENELIGKQVQVTVKEGPYLIINYGQ